MKLTLTILGEAVSIETDNEHVRPIQTGIILSHIAHEELLADAEIGRLVRLMKGHSLTATYDGNFCANAFNVDHAGFFTTPEEALRSAGLK